MSDYDERMAEALQTPVEAHISAEDERYPTLVLDGPWGTHGYALNRITGDLRRVCLCHAYSENECVCGAWGQRDD